MPEIIHCLRSKNINNILVEQTLLILNLLAVQDIRNRLLRVFYIDAI